MAEAAAGEPYPAVFRDMETVVFDMAGGSGGSGQAKSHYFDGQTDNVDGEEQETNTPIPTATAAQTVDEGSHAVSYTHLTLPTIYSV